MIKMVTKTRFEQVDLETLPKEVLAVISFLREKKSKGSQTLELIDKALAAAHDYVVRLHLEKALVYQHEVIEDRSGPRSKQNKGKQVKYIKKMEEATNEAKAYVNRYKLRRWESRIQRFLGRISDYKRNYSKAALHYKRAIITSREDPEYVYDRIPRWLEYQAFLAYSTLMAGDIKGGLSMSKQVYKKFDNTKEGKFLRKKDYPTWAIWKTGIPVRVGFWFIKRGKGFDKKGLLDWLKDADKYLKTPVSSKRWVGKVDFGFRKDEIKAIRRRIS